MELSDPGLLHFIRLLACESSAVVNGLLSLFVNFVVGRWLVDLILQGVGIDLMLQQRSLRSVQLLSAGVL